MAEALPRLDGADLPAPGGPRITDIVGAGLASLDPGLPGADEAARAKTASAMAGAATPSSRAVCAVHAPVPFCPASSTTTSTKGRPVAGSVRPRTSAVTSMR